MTLFLSDKVSMLSVTFERILKQNLLVIPQLLKETHLSTLSSLKVIKLGLMKEFSIFK